MPRTLIYVEMWLIAHFVCGERYLLYVICCMWSTLFVVQLDELNELTRARIKPNRVSVLARFKFKPSQASLCVFELDRAESSQAWLGVQPYSGLCISY